MHCGESAINSSKKPERATGFTLIEILLAFLILGIVLTTVLASFNAVFSTTESLDSGSRYFEMAKNSLNRMTLDLEALYVRQPPIYKKPEFNDPPGLYRIVGAASEISGTSIAFLRFASSAHIQLEKSRRDGIAEIVYYIQARDDGSMVLKRADNLYPYPEFEEKSADPVLCTNIKSLEFKYYDDQGAEYDEWDSDSDDFEYATPAAIRIQLEIGDKNATYEFETIVHPTARREKIE